jgi:hypothetical protein
VPAALLTIPPVCDAILLNVLFPHLTAVPDDHQSAALFHPLADRWPGQNQAMPG